MKVYITKYALIFGIMEVEAEQLKNYPNTVAYRANGSLLEQWFHGEGREWHRTKEAALDRANAMRLAEIAALKKQIVKLEKLTF